MKVTAAVAATAKPQNFTLHQRSNGSFSFNFRALSSSKAFSTSSLIVKPPICSTGSFV
jgi:hypothetical protein